ncbi:MAG: 50S ribosomal protein L9 [Candidatus Portnoybacteria bacterium CG10_big_fil_rev_8_21_14_0_10_40_22]|uniref:Large ribosomal subunit protein bL9 n=1 Tax=Candidatus Portnoybacteria bacterium CG10_big_fil_rev_8_21_14_0_10_40_22 TaxID=1974814 RepID=A0A2M8KG27_9BACT|nr:MAG: 50S ribosomal protein L9 [Candidatus Portnoybacteria bacterium CG10_big_fil_rev_8_21_14_0_10_40_22]
MLKIMKIVLLKDIKTLGQAGDIKDVSDGYARNFLIARGLGVLADKTALIQAEKVRIERARLAELELKDTESLVKKIDEQEFVIKAKAKDGKLFGGIGSAEIIEAIAKSGFKLPSSAIKLTKRLKEVGEHEVELHLPHNLEAKIKVIIKEE